jgi:hypothetical protein
MAQLHPMIAELLEQFTRTDQSKVHDVDQCARNPFPDCGVCLSLLDPLALRLIEATESPDCPRA